MHLSFSAPRSRHSFQFLFPTMVVYACVWFSGTSTACIDRYNDMKPKGSGHLNQISITNGDYVILDNLLSKTSIPLAVVPSVTKNQPARVLSISSFLNEEVVGLVTTAYKTGKDETPFYNVLSYNNKQETSPRTSYCTPFFNSLPRLTI